MDMKTIKIDLGEFGYANLIFNKYTQDGDWICQVESDHMAQIEELMEAEGLIQ